MVAAQRSVGVVFVAYDVDGEEWRVVTGVKVFMYF